MSIGAPTTVPVDLSGTGLERLKDRQVDTLEGEKERLKKATREFESFFNHQLLKTMRKTIPKSSLTGEAALSGDNGKEMYTDLFDMEMARKMAVGRNNSLADVLYRSMEPLLLAEFGQEAEKPTELRDLRPSGDAFTPLKSDAEQTISRQAVVHSLNRSRQVPGLRPTGHHALPQDSITERFGDKITSAASRHRLDPNMIHAVIRAESNGNPAAVSAAGAKGLMQLMDSTAASYGVTDATDPNQNIDAGTRYLRELLDRFGEPKLALAAYNAGPGRVEQYQGIPPFDETQMYVEKVLSFWRGNRQASNVILTKAGSHSSR